MYETTRRPLGAQKKHQLLVINEDAVATYFSAAPWQSIFNRQSKPYIRRPGSVMIDDHLNSLIFQQIWDEGDYDENTDVEGWLEPCTGCTNINRNSGTIVRKVIAGDGHETCPRVLTAASWVSAARDSSNLGILATERCFAKKETNAQQVEFPRIAPVQTKGKLMEAINDRRYLNR
ncbi:hypothetical protein ARMSODRAFT_1002712 [Armillaria solidipes]|uniref:Uncharacterized protein n=1 Tax=Armillaria solidipes TaxID=1076256 RepID=A0A2H3BL92_9AGAR|nr:hypothetical protein ARMSODRAFT_1002712 [Armillaria solidipes]